MPRTNLPHIIVSDRKETKPYQSVGRGGGKQKRSAINSKSAHVQTLIRRFDRAYRAAERERDVRLVEETMGHFTQGCFSCCSYLLNSENKSDILNGCT